MKTIDFELRQNLFTSIVMDCVDLVIAIDENYEVILVNNSTLQHSNRIFSIQIKEGQNLKQLLGSTRFIELWDRVFQTCSKTSKIFWNDNQEQRCEITCSPIEDNQGTVKVVYGVIRQLCNSYPISPQLDDDSKLGNFEQIADYFPHMVWTATPQGATDYYSQRWIDFTGLNSEQSTGWGWEAIIHPDDLKETGMRWTEAIQKGISYQMRYRLKKWDNSFHWHLGRAEPFRNSKGEIIKWLGTCTDIDEMVQVESKLSTVTSQLNLFLTAAHVGVWTLDVRTNRVTVDSNVLELYGINPNEFDNSLDQIYEHIQPEDRDKITAEIQRAARQKDFFDAEFQINNTEKFLASRGQVELDENGESIRMVGINWEITTRKLLEKERLQALEFQEEQGRQRIREAQEHQKRIEEFVDTICHEIRNPLNGISGMLSLMESSIQPVLENNYGEDFDFKGLVSSMLEHIHIMEQCAEQQRIIVDDVLDLSKVENDKLELSPTVFNPRNLLENLKNIFAGSLQQKQLECSVALSEGVDCTFKADAHRLTQIIMNLLSNSIKFTECGTITVQISKEIREGENRLLHFCVTDTGIGMTSDELSRLFNKFTQANSTIGIRYGGSGLGLVISKKLVERMGGTFQVKSVKGRGTQFNFSIQCKEVKDFKSLPKEQTNSTVTRNLHSKRILIVEDSIINQKILASYLQQQKCLCQIVNNGVEALSVAEQTKFDVIFMDLEMPLMGGLEATQKLRKKSSLNQFTPIIGLSGNARKEHIEEALNSGMNAYLTKPYHKTDIYKAVNQMCSRGEDYNQQKSTDKERAAKRKKSET